MPQNIIDVSTFTDPVQAMADADPADGPSARQPVQHLANRTRFLLNMLGGSPAQRKTMFGVDRAVFEQTATGEPFWKFVKGADSGPYAIPVGTTPGGGTFTNQYAWWVVKLATGVTLRELHVLFSKNADRAGAARWSASVVKRTFNWSAAAAAPAEVVIGGSQDDGGGSGYDYFSFGGLSEVIDGETEEIVVLVRGPSGSIGTSDRLIALLAVFDDPGARNW